MPINKPRWTCSVHIKRPHIWLEMVLNARYLTKEEGRNQMRIKCTKLLGTGQFEREKKRKSDERMKAERMASFLSHFNISETGQNFPYLLQLDCSLHLEKSYSSLLSANIYSCTPRKSQHLLCFFHSFGTGSHSKQKVLLLMFMEQFQVFKIDSS